MSRRWQKSSLTSFFSVSCICWERRRGILNNLDWLSKRPKLEVLLSSFLVLCTAMETFAYWVMLQVWVAVLSAIKIYTNKKDREKSGAIQRQFFGKVEDVVTWWFMIISRLNKQNFIAALLTKSFESKTSLEVLLVQ